MGKCDLKSLLIGLILELSRPQRPLNTVVLYYYGGHLMPGLPVWDKAAYPYAVIIPLGAVRVLLCKSHPFTAVGGKLYLAETTAAIAATVRGRVWEFAEPGQYAPGAWATSVEAVIWSNYDIQDESGTVAVGATEPVKLGGKREPVAYLYNGVDFVERFTWDEKKYPHVVIETVYTLSTIRGRSFAYCADKPFVYEMEGTSSYLRINSSVNYCKYNYSSTDGWVKAQDESGDSFSHLVGIGYKYWTNHDIIGTTSGNVVYEASEPVPVYE